MLDRAAILERFALPDRAAFEFEPHRDELGVWWVKISHDGDPALLFAIGAATRLADEIRGVDPALAEQIEACIEQARRYAAGTS